MRTEEEIRDKIIECEEWLEKFQCSIYYEKTKYMLDGLKWVLNEEQSND